MPVPASGPGARGAARVGVMPSDRQLEARVREVLRESAACAEVHGFATAAALRLALEELPFTAVIVGARDASGVPTDAAIQRIRYGFPRLTVVGYIRGRVGCSSQVLALANAGVHELVLEGVDDVGVALRSALHSAARQSIVAEVQRTIQGHVPPSVWPFVRYCLGHLDEPLTVPSIASALGVHRKTLVNWMRAARCPPPREMATWCRLLVAAWMLQEPSRVIEQVALDLEFPSGNGFRNVLRRYAGLSPSEARTPEGLSAVVARFAEAMSGAPAAPASAPASATPAGLVHAISAP